ncbi:MAG: type II secretion system inner membrane protein GspF [Bdellovibrionales bacterium]|nr:type II secretion system inner membrane protein GspF [Bdellovibrionales bacterium]
MPVFEYKGLNKSGKSIRGTIDSENVRMAKSKLKRDGIYVNHIKNKSTTTSKQKKSKSLSHVKIPIGELAMMTRQLATLLKANVPLVDSLAAVAEQVENQELSEMISLAKNNVNEGGALHKSLSKYPKTFNKIYISMVEAGEMSGTLDTILMRLAEFTESQNELSQKIKSAMLYPIIMVFFMAGMMVLLFTYVIPKITEVFDSSPELVLPWYSKMIINISEFMINYYLPIGIAVASIIALFVTWKNSDSGRVQWDAISLKAPVFGKLVRMIAVSRFTRTLSTLLDGGVPMLTAMGIVRNVVNNEILATAIDNARDNISEGESIAGPLKKSKQFPPIVIHMISIGEKTGELETMLTQVSDAYDFQVKNSVEGLTSILSPIMLIVMGTVVGIIVFAIMIPIFEMSNIS